LFRFSDGASISVWIILLLFLRTAERVDAHLLDQMVSSFLLLLIFSNGR
jgi:hypothetical protein